MSSGAYSLAALSLGVAACGADKGTPSPSTTQAEVILLVASIENPALSVDSSGTEPRIDGSFDLLLSLDAKASRGTTGLYAGFQAMNAANRSTAIPVLHVMTSHQEPFGVMPGEAVRVPFTIENSRLDDPADLGRLCAGSAIIWGAIYDSLNQVQVGAFGPEFSATNCP